MFKIFPLKVTDDMIIGLQNDSRFTEISQSKKKLLALKYLLPNPNFLFSFSGDVR